MKIKKKIKKEITDVREEIKKKTVGYVVTALGLVAGLAWNDAVKGLIDYFFPVTQQSVWAKLIYALVLTIVVGLISVYLVKLFKKDDERKVITEEIVENVKNLKNQSRK